MKENLFSILWDRLRYSEQERFAKFIFNSVQEYLQKNEEFRNDVISRVIRGLDSQEFKRFLREKFASEIVHIMVQEIQKDPELCAKIRNILIEAVQRIF